MSDLDFNNALAELVPLNTLLLRRQRKLVLPVTEATCEGDARLPLHYMATLLKNIESLGFTFSPELFEAVRGLSERDAVALYRHLVPALKVMVGAHRKFAPMYPDFPTQVMEASEAELYMNAIFHYMGDLFGARLLPHYVASERPALADTLELKAIGVGSLKDLKLVARRLIGAKSSISATDKEDLALLVVSFHEELDALLPEEIPHKENLSALTALLMEYEIPALDRVLGRYFKTATDVLRLATALSAGDVSLAQHTKFRSFKRAERRLLLALVERCAAPVEDMLRHKGRWVRLGERLHPGEYRAQFPRAAAAFDVLRKDLPFATFAHRVEAALLEQDVPGALALLATRPGELARRLDHLLRLSESEQARGEVIEAFAGCCDRVASPVLLQVRAHFAHRNDGAPIRAFFPKGNVARVITVENALEALSEAHCQHVVAVCDQALMGRFATLEPLGEVYVEPTLENYLVPFSQRSASKALRTLVRGSRLPMPEGDTIRFFLWWKEGMVDGKPTGRVDIDLSSILYGEQWNYLEHISYTNLRSVKYNAAHSGDITSAPNGACEFIDLDIPSILAYGGRYVVMNVYSFSSQAFCDLPECYAGWMMRQEPRSGEIFEPATVVDKVDLAADTRICIPVVLDLREREVIWADLALKSHPRFHINVESNERGVAHMGRAITTLPKPTLGTLFALHAAARGTVVDSPEQAQTRFMAHATRQGDITPFDVERIMAEFM